MIKKGILLCCLLLFIKKIVISSGSHAQTPPLKSVITGIIEPPSRILNDTDGVTGVIEEEMRALCFVQRVNHLEDSLEFYRENFGFQVVCHEEKAGESKNTAYSRSMIKNIESHPCQEFSIELLHTYGINRHQRGNDLRGLVLKSSAYKGDLDVLEMDPYGQRFLETPDGHWIILVDDSELDSDDLKVAPAMMKSISLCVSNLTSSARFYANILGADVVLDSEECSALCTWRSKVNDSSSVASRHKEVAVELVQLPPPGTVDFRASQGLLLIETDEIELERLRPFADNVDGVKHVSTSRGVAPLHHEDEEFLSLSISDEDGHQYSFVPIGAFRRRETSLQYQGKAAIDWDLRDVLSTQAASAHSGLFGDHVIELNASSYSTRIEDCDSDVLINFHAPWCIFCVQNHPVYGELAKRFTEINGDKILFTAIDGSATPVSRVRSTDLNTMLMWAKREGYPALFFLPKGCQDLPIEYQGEWTIRSISEWIQIHATQETLDLSDMDYTETFQSETTDEEK